jgi:hypothetical protein
VTVLKREFPITVGETFQIEAYVYEDPKLTKQFDLAGSDLTFTASDDRVNPTITVEKTIGSGIFVVDAVTGHVRVTLTAEDTAVLGQYGGVLHFDLNLTDADSLPWTIAKGKLILEPDAV